MAEQPRGTRPDEILQKYNRHHDSRGRFASGGARGAGGSAPGVKGVTGGMSNSFPNPATDNGQKASGRDHAELQAAGLTSAAVGRHSTFQSAKASADYSHRDGIKSAVFRGRSAFFVTEGEQDTASMRTSRYFQEVHTPSKSTRPRGRVALRKPQADLGS